MDDAAHARINACLGPARQNKKSKYTGVCWDKAAGKWIVQLRHNGVRHTVGRFAEEEDAAAAYRAAGGQEEIAPVEGPNTRSFLGSWKRCVLNFEADPRVPMMAMPAHFKGEEVRRMTGPKATEPAVEVTEEQINALQAEVKVDHDEAVSALTALPAGARLPDILQKRVEKGGSCEVRHCASCRTSVSNMCATLCDSGQWCCRNTASTTTRAW